MDNASTEAFLAEVERKLEESRANLLEKAFAVLEFNFDPAIYDVVMADAENESPFLYHVIEKETDTVLFDICLHPSLDTLINVKFKFDELTLLPFLSNESVINKHVAYELKLLKVFNHLNNKALNEAYLTSGYNIDSFWVDVSFYLNSISFECKKYAVYTCFTYVKSKWYLTEPIVAHLNTAITKLLKDLKFDVSFDFDTNFDADATCDLIDMYKI